MLSTRSKEEIIQQYISSGKIMYEAEQTGDWRKGNKEYEKLVKVFKELEQDRTLAESCLLPLLKNDNIEVRMIAAQECLSLGIRVKDALKVFKKAAADNNNGIYSFEAKMTLKVWREQGYLLVYEEQEIHYCHKPKRT